MICIAVGGGLCLKLFTVIAFGDQIYDYVIDPLLCLAPFALLGKYLERIICHLDHVLLVFVGGLGLARVNVLLLI